MTNKLDAELPRFPMMHQFAHALSMNALNISITLPQRIEYCGPAGKPFFVRAIVQRQDDQGCVYLHQWQRDDNEEPHDHPWDFTVLILHVGYWEITPEGRFWRKPGDVVFHKAEDRHRVELETDHEVHHDVAPLSLVITGPRRREWGFWVPSDTDGADDIWVHHKDYRQTLIRD